MDLLIAKMYAKFQLDPHSSPLDPVFMDAARGIPIAQSSVVYLYP